MLLIPYYAVYTLYIIYSMASSLMASCSVIALYRHNAVNPADSHRVQPAVHVSSVYQIYCHFLIYICIVLSSPAIIQHPRVSVPIIRPFNS